MQKFTMYILGAMALSIAIAAPANAMFAGLPKTLAGLEGVQLSKVDAAVIISYDWWDYVETDLA